MKNIIRNIVLLVTLLFAVSIQAQDTSSNNKALTKKEIRAQKRAERLKAKEEKRKQAEAYEQILHAQAVTGIDSMAFVLEANQVYDRYGNIENVNGNINFVSVNGDRAVFQLGFDGVVGLNGVGGITMEGKISDYEVKEEKNGRRTVTFNVMGPVMLARMQFSIDGSGNYANVKVNAQTENIELSFRGVVKPSQVSTVYEGMKLF
ncbi:DUF4251 domain-containing protein [Flammeovirga yaeyamensis]|uniref:DUF4251 domain-containing protein n=1 Tax=Flammeovirga yaeyamensis TaxID=367791 RepID=A0AAX1N185_9BACT|nr:MULTISPECIES: DUF4251 domain-containing protein [Flammeovirga]ANQ47502.1 DUF4251 domain-containing protein [Flammeovirga sp. MY04]MBB3698541.1 ATPase subunit of ABC transporter with duplicated ATPase domains [Flammeovirga yaeyamensis]NMF34110.1 DUF4251 domain-containing protein [Flammeovirga yaeyamensis]QWG01097.1 DUF4251 domain-containing protein [Flammeovirga yaeyamensis]